MRYKINLLDPREYDQLIKLAEKVGLDEKIDFKSTFLVAKDSDGKILGACGINFDKDIPRCKHIIVEKPYQKSGLSVLLLRRMETFVRSLGYSVYSAYILNTKFEMQKYAKKFGFTKWEDRKDGKWYLKNLAV